MSWSNSSLTTDYFPSIALSGSVALCGGEELNAFYSTNAGQTWSDANAIDGYNVFALSNSIGIAGLNTVGEPPSVMYTTNGGAAWSSSNLSGSVNALAISSLNAVASISGDGIYYSTNGGQTWTQSNITTDDFNCLYMVPSSTVVLAGSASGSGIFYSTNNGQTWTQSSMTSDNVLSLAASGSNAVAGSGGNTGLYYSSDSGVTWTQSGIIFGDWPYVGIDDQGRAIAASTSFAGIFYSTNSGANWSGSNISIGTFSLSMNDSGAIAAALADATGIYYTVDGGQTWTASNFTTSTYFNAILSGGNAIASSAVGNGMAYSSGPLCFHRNVLILCDAGPGRRRVYRPIYHLKVGDKVWTHRHGAVRIKHIASAELICGLFSDDAAQLYRHKKTGAMITGAHRLLVEPNEMPASIAAEQKRRYGLDQHVDGMAMWMTCLHPDFEKVDSVATFGKNKKQQLFHLVLEHDNEPTRHYGVYMNDGVLAETCDEVGFQRMYDSVRVLQQQQKQMSHIHNQSTSLMRASCHRCRRVHPSYTSSLSK